MVYHMYIVYIEVIIERFYPTIWTESTYTIYLHSPPTILTAYQSFDLSVQNIPAHRKLIPQERESSSQGMKRDKSRSILEGFIDFSIQISQIMTQVQFVVTLWKHKGIV